MTPFEQFLNMLSGAGPAFSVWWLVKILFLIGLLIYLAFAVIIIRQIGLMSKTLKTDFSFPLKLIAWIHLAAAVFIFMLALVIL